MTEAIATIRDNRGRFIKGSIPPKRFYPSGVNHCRWKEKVTYMHLHDWVREKKGKAKKCFKCGTTKGRIEWANIDRKYKRNLDDFFEMCTSCHTKHDKNLIRNNL